MKLFTNNDKKLTRSNQSNDTKINKIRAIIEAKNLFKRREQAFTFNIIYYCKVDTSYSANRYIIY